MSDSVFSASQPKIWFITGTSTGFGRVLAEHLLATGHSVVATARDISSLDDLTTRYPATAQILTLDVTNEEAIAAAVKDTLARFGRIDVLVNNAGGVAVGNISEQDDDALYEQMETHIIVPLALTREALPHLRVSKGLIVYFGSGVARIPVGTLGAYPPAKSAVRSMARIARNELRSSGIAVTYVDPGAVATEFMTRAGFAGPPPGVAALPADVAKAVFETFTKRKPVVNAVPWQTFFVSLAEKAPQITDFLLSKAPALVGGQLVNEPSPPVPAIAPAVTTIALTVEPETAVAPFDAALSGQLARMTKFKMTPAFARSILVPGSELELGEVAMRWAGMPNKHERALTNDVLDALAAAGYLEHLEPERYRVLRDADS